MDIRTYLEREGLTQAALAARAGVSVTAVCRAISRKRQPGRAVATRIVQATGGAVSFEDLWATCADYHTRYADKDGPA